MTRQKVVLIFALLFIVAGAAFAQSTPEPTTSKASMLVPLWFAAAMLLAFVIVYCIAFASLKDSGYNFDPQGEHGEFEPHMKRWQDIAKLVLTLAAGTSAFLMSQLKERSSETKFIRIQSHTPTCLLLLAITIALCLTFLLYETKTYEDYCHGEKYTRTKYAFNVALGLTGIVSFVTAYGVLAVAILG